MVGRHTAKQHSSAVVRQCSGTVTWYSVEGIAGSGLHSPKLIFGKKKTRSPSTVFQIDPAHGEGLYLSPWKGDFKSGTGLYLSPYPHKAGSGLHKLESGMFSSHCTQFSSPQKKTLKSLVDLL